MTQIANLSATIPAALEPAASEGFRIPNPLRSGLLSFVATIAAVAGGAVVLNISVDRGLDSYYEKQLAMLAEPTTDAALGATANEDAPASVVTLAN